MPEKILKSHFDLSLLEVGTPVKITILAEQKGIIAYGYITESSLDAIYVGAFDEENNPTCCKITTEQVLEEVVTIEVL
ncbi:MAG: hypothetical protein AB9856_20725 [Cellulosilyticaceae bacterium]